MRNSKVLVFLSIILSITFIGCGVFSDDNNAADQDIILSGYYWLAGDSEALAEGDSERASINVYDLSEKDTVPLSFAALIAKGDAGTKVANYPERGLMSNYVVSEEDAANKVYKVAVTSTFPKRDEIFDYYLETYYVQDSGTVDDWTSADPIVKKVDGSWVSDSTAREKMELHYDNGDIRYEWIVSDSSTTGEYYDHFNIDGDLSIPESSWTPPVASGMVWSSEVHYYQEIEDWVGYWYRENKEIFGVRYYTESLEGDKPVKSTLSFERIVYQETMYDETDANAVLIFLDALFGTNTASSTTRETLSETVIRDFISANGKKTTKTKTTIVPTFGDSIVIDKASSYDL